MSKTQEEIAKELFNHGSMKEHGKDEKGRTIMYNRQIDNLTSSGITIDKDGKIEKYNR
jgi:hypothetical protein